MSALILYRDENSAKVTSFRESIAVSSVKSELACENLSIWGILTQEIDAYLQSIHSED